MKRYPLVREKIVVVTGASTGIGRATARLLQARGWEVYPTARKAADLESLRSEGFTPVELDLESAASVEQAAARVVELSRGRLGAVVNNAGYGQPGALEDIPREAARKQFETNVIGTLDLTNRLIPFLRAQGAGRIVLVTSVLGRVAIPFMGVYCASKFAAEALGDVWRVELAPAGIAVSLVEPGPIRTEFRRRAVREAAEHLAADRSVFRARYGRDWSEPVRSYRRPTDIFRKPPGAVAAKIAHALESSRPRARYPVTAPAWFGEVAARLFPSRLRDWLLASKVIEQQME